MELTRWFERSSALRRALRPPPRPPEALARVVSIASGKGGTGKSVLSSNLAVLRARRGERVLLVDFDSGLANDHLLLGLTPERDLSDVLNGRATVDEALVAGPGGLQLLSGGVGAHELADPTRRELDRLFRVLEPLEARFDLVLIDHPAGMGFPTQAHLAATCVAILVTGHEITALSDAYAIYKRALFLNPLLRAGLVVNRAPGEREAQAAWERFQGVSAKFLGKSPEFLGFVPADDAVGRSVEARSPVSSLEPDSPSARAFIHVARWSALDQVADGGSFYARARRALH